MALWSLCSDVVGLVGGETLGSETYSFQIVCTACRAHLRRSGRLWLRGGSAEGSGHDAVQGRVRRGSVSLTLDWERGARSGRSRWASDRARAGAKGQPTNGMGGSRRLGSDDGGWGLLVAWWQGRA
jgi:hypothetical protein